ncbi:Erp family outer-surface lipoprotein [Borreliella americana]|uniref:Erp family outer-surface lipoprotein n=1 Tax=Borreliella americana TaxID=478807 RepID=UPI001E5B6D87|nr:Erp family outer-surface lipoprotein [Borreliella americana]MCD2332779.1 Erp family outer-surface lipoprotein [Borreliella americana]
MNKNINIKMFIICAIFVALISSCKNHTSYDGQSSDESEVKNIKFSEFTVKIKNKDTSGSNWTDLGTVVVRKERNGIETGLNVNPGYTATFFTLEEAEVANFIKAMTEGGSFKASLYYGYKDEQNVANSTKNKEIKTKIENIDGSQYITFLGDNKTTGGKIAQYAIPLEELKKNLK